MSYRGKKPSSLRLVLNLPARVLAAVENGRLYGFVAAHSLTTLFYLLAKAQSAQSARTIITDLLQFLSVAGVNQVTLEQALNLPYNLMTTQISRNYAPQVE